MADTLVSDVKRSLYLHSLDADTLRYLAEALDDHAMAVHAEEKALGKAKMRHAHSATLRLWAERFRTDANRLEATNES